jgi:hypothetical protein
MHSPSLPFPLIVGSSAILFDNGSVSAKEANRREPTKVVIVRYMSLDYSFRWLRVVFSNVDSVFVPTAWKTHKWLLINRLGTQDQKMDPDRNLGRSESRPDTERIV